MKVALLLSAEPVAGLMLARAWVAAGEDVEVVLLDRAVAAARRGHGDAAVITESLAAGIVVGALDESLRRRGIEGAALVDGVKPVDLDELADLVGEGADKAVWL